MLKNLSIRNLALIRHMDIGFSDGLNILTGETGAGKSIIIDSITMALGGKVARSLVREDAPDALAELTFSVGDPETLSALSGLEVFPEDGELVLSRRIRGGRSSVRVNGELRSAQEVREIGSLLLDIHGQSEHQKLLSPEHQLALLDAYGGEETAALKQEVAKAHAAYTEKKKALSELDEVMNLSDRILVIYEGEIVGEFDPKKVTVQELGLYMAGAKKQSDVGKGA